MNRSAALSMHSDSDSGCAAEEYTWAPSCLSPEQVRRYYSCMPENKVPFPKSEGERYRIQQLTYQLPPQDSEPKLCRSLSEVEIQEMQFFKTTVRRDSLGRGSVRQLPDNLHLFTGGDLACDQCRVLFEPGQLAVFAARAGNTRAWHPQCFVCSQCSNILVDNIYFYDNGNGKLYCGRHYAELSKPRCAACDELIFSDECTEAEGFSWHVNHFVCMSCEEPLAAQRYLVRGDDRHHPYCLRCYSVENPEICTACQGRISRQQDQVSRNGLFWHNSPACYACSFCGQAINSESPETVFDTTTFDLFCSGVCQHNSARSAAVNKENLEALLMSSAPQLLADVGPEEEVGRGGPIGLKNLSLIEEEPSTVEPDGFVESSNGATAVVSADCDVSAGPNSVGPIILGRPPHVLGPVHELGVGSSQQQQIKSLSMGIRKVHFPRSVSFPDEASNDKNMPESFVDEAAAFYGVSAGNNSNGQPRRHHRHHRHHGNSSNRHHRSSSGDRHHSSRNHRRHHHRRSEIPEEALYEADACSTCSSSSSDSEDELNRQIADGSINSARSHQYILGGGNSGAPLAFTATSSLGDAASVSSSNGSIRGGGTSKSSKAAKNHHKRRGDSKNCFVS